MPKTTGHLLKAGTVQWQGSLPLDLNPKVAPNPAAASQATAPAKIRIAENHPQFALVEVTCSCGKTMLVRCEYSESEGSPTPAEIAPS